MTPLDEIKAILAKEFERLHDKTERITEDADRAHDDALKAKEVVTAHETMVAQMSAAASNLAVQANKAIAAWEKGDEIAKKAGELAGQKAAKAAEERMKQMTDALNGSIKEAGKAATRLERATSKLTIWVLATIVLCIVACLAGWDFGTWQAQRNQNELRNTFKDNSSG